MDLQIKDILRDKELLEQEIYKLVVEFEKKYPFINTSISSVEEIHDIGIRTFNIESKIKLKDF